MHIVVLANEEQKHTLVVAEAFKIEWVTDIHAFTHYPSAGAFIDLLYSSEAERNAVLARLAPALVFVNSVADTLPETDAAFIRFNGWTTFLTSPVVEASCIDVAKKPKAEQVFSVFGKKLEWAPDEPGFITARVVSMIINEAYLALDEGISTREDINTAMKLGTAYPYGPFEWGEKIGLKKVAGLLDKLSRRNTRYQPAPLLLKEAGLVS
ncbi:MAG TPA: 3-hydroxyacyl-CoA dehydrogenase family protein [Flavisolibacter sp.]|nr:3-hydroxyacyl-CoA dehydrogenase family protein [Flavisolibacter sp.]